MKTLHTVCQVCAWAAARSCVDGKQLRAYCVGVMHYMSQCGWATHFMRCDMWDYAIVCHSIMLAKQSLVVQLSAMAVNMA